MIRSALVLGCLVLLIGAPFAEAGPIDELVGVCVSLQGGSTLDPTCVSTPIFDTVFGLFDQTIA